LRGRREETVIATARSGRDAVGYLALHHQNGTGDPFGSASGKQLQQNVRGDVVRQIPDHVSCLALRCKRAEIGLQNIAFDNRYLWLIAKPEGQFGCKSPVEFQSNQPMAAPSKYLGNRAVTGTNFNYCPLGKIAKSVDNGVAGSIVHKKVLAEFWLTFHLHPMVSGSPRALID